MKILFVLLVICVAVYAEPPRFGRRFNASPFARQEDAPPAANGDGYNYPEPEEKPTNGGYHYPTPEYGLPDPDSQPPPAPEQEPTTTAVPDADNTTEDNNEVDPESETLETPQIDDAQADQLRRANLRKKGRKGRPLKLVAVQETPLQYQRLVYYPVQQQFARFEQPIAVPVAVPQQGFAYSTQVFQQNW